MEDAKRVVGMKKGGGVKWVVGLKEERWLKKQRWTFKTGGRKGGGCCKTDGRDEKRAVEDVKGVVGIKKG
jgi:hypothetical protein